MLPVSLRVRFVVALCMLFTSIINIWIESECRVDVRLSYKLALWRRLRLSWLCLIGKILKSSMIGLWFEFLFADYAIAEPLWDFSSSVCGDDVAGAESWPVRKLRAVGRTSKQLWLQSKLQQQRELSSETDATSEPLFRHNGLRRGNNSLSLSLFSLTIGTVFCQSTA